MDSNLTPATEPETDLDSSPQSGATRQDGAPRAPRRVRRDGWTRQRQLTFLNSLALTGSVQRSALLAGMSPSSAYRLRLHPDAAAFRHAWTCALRACATLLRQVALDRAINGTLQDVIYQGSVIGTRVVHNDRLLMYMLREHGGMDSSGPQQHLVDSFQRLESIDDPDAEPPFEDD